MPNVRISYSVFSTRLVDYDDQDSQYTLFVSERDLNFISDIIECDLSNIHMVSLDNEIINDELFAYLILSFVIYKLDQF